MPSPGFSANTVALLVSVVVAVLGGVPLLWLGIAIMHDSARIAVLAVGGLLCVVALVVGAKLLGQVLRRGVFGEVDHVGRSLDAIV